MAVWNWFRAAPSRAYTAVAVLLVAMFMTTTTLARYYHEEQHARAQDHFARGSTLVDAGNLDQGIVQLRAALLLDRGNADYALILATALLDAGHPREAETYLDDAIREDPTSGPANLVRARVARALGDAETDVYYQRSYFGSWPADARDQRLAVGFELVEYLLALDARERAHAVLAQLAAETGRDPDLDLRVGRLFLDANGAADAIPLLMDATEQRPDDAAAWSALAEAQFEEFNDTAAARAAARAVALDPRDMTAARIADVARSSVGLDPSQPRLRATERTRRARQLVELSRAAYEACVPAPAGDAPPDPLVDEAARALNRRTRPAPDNDELVELATRLWDARTARCPDVDPDVEALQRVLSRLAGREPVS
ncbi:MAG: tetratricopeptide repeat protein [Vicinamibacterales bacterium]